MVMCNNYYYIIVIFMNITTSSRYIYILIGYLSHNIYNKIILRIITGYSVYIKLVALSVEHFVNIPRCWQLVDNVSCYVMMKLRYDNVCETLDSYYYVDNLLLASGFAHILLFSLTRSTCGMLSV